MFPRPGWVYEEKYDGWRMLAYKQGRTVRLVSRRGRDHTRTFPDIAAAIASLPANTVVLDGEVCVFDQTLVSQFYLLTDEPETVIVITSPMYAVFDCLNLRGRDLRDQPLLVRRQALETLHRRRSSTAFRYRRAAGLCPRAPPHDLALDSLVPRAVSVSAGSPKAGPRDEPTADR